MNAVGVKRQSGGHVRSDVPFRERDAWLSGVALRRSRRS